MRVTKREVIWPDADRVRLIRSGSGVDLIVSAGEERDAFFSVSLRDAASLAPSPEPFFVWGPANAGSASWWDAARLADGRLVLITPIQPAIFLYVVDGKRLPCGVSWLARPRFVREAVAADFIPFAGIQSYFEDNDVRKRRQEISVVERVTPMSLRDIRGARDVEEVVLVSRNAVCIEITRTAAGSVAARVLDARFGEVSFRSLSFDEPIFEVDACSVGDDGVAVAALGAGRIHVFRGRIDSGVIQEIGRETLDEVDGEMLSPAVCADALGLHVAFLQKPGGRPASVIVSTLQN